jgi:hypothetical protein
MSFPRLLAKVVSRTLGVALVARASRYRSWPSDAALIDAPLAPPSIVPVDGGAPHANGHRDARDGPAVFRAGAP